MRVINNPSNRISLPNPFPCNLPNSTLRVDDEKTTESNTFLLDEDTIISGDLLGLIGQDRDLHLTETTLLARLVNPGQVRELGVSGGSDDSSVQSLELGDSVRESDDLSRADESEVHGVPEEDDILTLCKMTIST